MHDNRTIGVLKALADPTRLKLVRELAKSPSLQESCSRLCAKESLSQPAMSHHFSKLVSAGVVVEEKIGKQKSYKLNRDLLEDCGIVPEHL